MDGADVGSQRMPCNEKATATVPASEGSAPARLFQSFASEILLEASINCRCPYNCFHLGPWTLHLPWKPKIGTVMIDTKPAMLRLVQTRTFISMSGVLL